MTKEHVYKVKGMHCASCEVLIEKKILGISGVKAVDASTGNGEVTVEYEGEKPAVGALNEIFKHDNYAFADAHEQQQKAKGMNPTLLAFDIAIVLVIGFLLLQKLGLANFLTISAASSVWAFFAMGILASLSSCAALVGGMVLSMSKQWNHQHATASPYQKFQPHVLFNLGRIVSYAFFGALLGVLGSAMQISFQVTSLLVMGVSVIMIVLGLQMLGMRYANKIRFAVPKFITRHIANEENFKGKYMPLMVGAATFFLPCGFTVAAQGMALLSGGAFPGALMLGFFALGTAPLLLVIGLSSVKLLEKQQFAHVFSKTAGFLVIFFALFTLYNQSTALGYLNIAPAVAGSQQIAPLAKVVDGKQVIAMTAYGNRYDPDKFTVKAGVPVRWEVTASGEPSCTGGAVISNLLPQGILYLKQIAGQVTVAEFTPQNPGNYRFSCTMGMFTGNIQVIN